MLRFYLKLYPLLILIPITLQVNNAGTSVKRSLMESTIEDLDLMLNLFVRAVFTITQRALPSLLENKGTYNRFMLIYDQVHDRIIEHYSYPARTLKI